MNTRLITSALFLSASSLVFSLQSGAAVPAVDARGVAALTVCGTTATVPTILHSDKIVFFITGQLGAAITADQAKLNALPRGTPLDIKVRDNPAQIADLKGKVLSFLGAAVNPENAQSINITAVLYATAVCNPKGW